MKKLYKIEEAIYTVSPVKIENEEIVVQKIEEHIDNLPELVENKIKILVDDNKINEDSGKMKAIINKDDFKSLFGPTKPKKGDYISLLNTQKKYKINRSKKISVRKKGKGYKLSLKKVD